jgi:hypothetical protein
MTADRLFFGAGAPRRRPKSGSNLRSSDGLWGIRPALHFGDLWNWPLEPPLSLGLADVAGANAYAHPARVKPEPFITRFGAPTPPREFGKKVVSVLGDPTYAEGFAFGSRTTRESQCSRQQRLEHRTVLAEPGPPGAASRSGRRAAAEFCIVTAHVLRDRSSTERTSCKTRSSGLPWRCRTQARLPSCRPRSPNAASLHKDHDQHQFAGGISLTGADERISRQSSVRR